MQSARFVAAVAELGSLAATLTKIDPGLLTKIDPPLRCLGDARPEDEQVVLDGRKRVPDEHFISPRSRRTGPMARAINE